MKIKSPASSLVQTQANKTQARMNKLFDQISSGARITKAADDAAALIVPDIEPLPAVINTQLASAPDAPQVHAPAPGNLSIHHHRGDEAAVR